MVILVWFIIPSSKYVERPMSLLYLATAHLSILLCLMHIYYRIFTKICWFICLFFWWHFVADSTHHYWSGIYLILTCLICMDSLQRMIICMTMNLNKVFILTTFNHRLFALPAFCGLFPSDDLHLATILLYYMKKCLRHFNSPAPQSWGVGLLFLSIWFIIIPWTFYKRFLKTITKSFNIHFIPEMLKWKISLRWFIVVTLLLAAPCMPARTAAT